MITLDQVKIVYSQRKTIGLQINEKGIFMKVPENTSNKKIKQVFEDVKNWIEKNLIKFKKRLQQKINMKPNYKYKEGEKFLYLGKYYPLKILPNIKKPKFDNYFYVPEKYKNHIKDIIIILYKNIAQKFLINRIKQFSKKYKLQINEIKLSNATTKWGSCNSSNRISINWRLIMTPQEIIDYIIIHELSHVLHKNHSKDFWDKVKSLCPNYKDYEKWLKENQEKLFLN